jgi:hypothetical protein
MKKGAKEKGNQVQNSLMPESAMSAAAGYTEETKLETVHGRTATGVTRGF